MNDSNIQVTEEMAEKYANAKNISISEAKKRLRENFKAELKDVDVRQMYVKLIKSYREMAPKVEGIVMRETDMNIRITSLSHEVTSLKNQIHELGKQLDLHKDTFNEALKILNNIVKEDKNTMARIKALETPFYERMWNKIKCLLKI